jgi:hypothetical protein
MAAASPAQQQRPEEIREKRPRWNLFSSFVLLVVFLDAVALTWYLGKIPESSFDHLHKVLTGLGGWITPVLTYFGIKVKVQKQPEWRVLSQQLPVVLIVSAATVIIWFLLLPFHTLTVRVTDDGGPVGKATARFLDDKGPQASFSDQSGVLKLGGLSAATYYLVVAREGCTDQQVTVPFSSVIFPGGFASVNLACAPAGVLMLSSEPSGAQITLDAQGEGITPREIRLSPGLHHISLELPHYVRQDFDGQVKAGERDSVFKKLTPISGPLRMSVVLVRTAPEGVQIAVDGADKGSGPMRAMLGAGEHRITATFGSRMQSKTILVPDQSIVTFDFRESEAQQ